jgi:hypothetical protein
MSEFVAREFLSEETWTVFTGVWERLAAINLSESYEKGTMGLRKSGSTAASASLESIVRGVLAGAPRVQDYQSTNKSYNRGDARQLEQAWDDAVQEMVYGDLLSRIFAMIKKSGDIQDLPPVAIAALDYMIIQ